MYSRSGIQRLWSCILVLQILLASTSYAEVTEFALVQCPKYLRIREEPNINSPIAGVICDGGGCQVVKRGDEWCAVKSGDVFGYVLSEYLMFGDEAYTKAEAYKVATAEFVSASEVYSKPDINSEVCFRPPPASSYDVVTDLGDWLKLDMFGWDGYVLKSDKVKVTDKLRTATKYSELSGISEQRKSIVSRALEYLGNRYVWGGDDPNTGADCSGFVRYVYNKEVPQVWLPRVSYEQCYNGALVSSTEMLPGDLVFYAYDSGRVHHVAMYIGNGMIVHAASRRQGIIISQWNYQSPKYIRNVLND